MSATDKVVLAIDLGGTRIKAGLIAGYDLLDQLIVPTNDDAGFAAVLQTLQAVGDELLGRCPASAVGVSVPAVVRPADGAILDIRKNLLGLVGFPLRETLSRHFGLPVVVENDARLYGLGEALAGAARGAANMVCLTLGTGVGSCVMLDGRVLRGRSGLGGILSGHLTIEAGGSRCTCGNIGCIETVCRAAALVEEARLLAAWPDHPLAAGPTSSPEAVFEAAAGGDAQAGAALTTYLRHLGAAVVSCVHAYDPEVVVLGGGIMHAAAQIVPAVQRFVEDHTWTVAHHPVAVVASALGDHAALVGAAALARGEAEFW